MPVDLITLLSPKNLIFFIIVFTRLSGMMVTIPLLSVYPIPTQIKLWFMAVVAFIIFPIVMVQVDFTVPASMPALTVILLKEFIIGFVIGFIADIVFIGAEISASLISMQMGLTAAQAMNPTTGDTSPILTQAYTIMVSMIFIGINGYKWIFAAIYETFKILPPGYEFIINGNFTNSIIVLSSKIFSIGLGLALPIFAVLFITDVLLGFTAKMMPKMNIFMVALPVKIYIGLSVFLLIVPLMSPKIYALLETYLGSIMKVWGG